MLAFSLTYERFLRKDVSKLGMTEDTDYGPLAGLVGTWEGPVCLLVKARDGADAWGLSQSPFMRDNARTVAFEHTDTHRLVRAKPSD